MDTFNIISGIASLLSLLISLFVMGKVIKIENKINIDASINKKISTSEVNQIQTLKGNNNLQAGRDINAK